MEKLMQECKECKVIDELRSKLCSVCLTQRLIRGKWKILIIFLLKDGALRFSQIKKSIPKVTQAYLSSQLKELEVTGMIVRESYNQVPPKVEYYLTEEGKSFIKIIDSMHFWGVDYIKANVKK